MMYSATMMMPGMEEGNANNFKDELKTSLKDGVKPIVDLIFDYFDKDGDGNITEQEFVMATQALEGSPQGACEAVFKVVEIFFKGPAVAAVTGQVFAVVDADGDGKITLAEG